MAEPVMLEGGFQAGYLRSQGLTPRNEYVAFNVEEGQEKDPRATIGRSCTSKEKRKLKRMYNLHEVERVPCTVPEESRRAFLLVTR